MSKTGITYEQVANILPDLPASLYAMAHAVENSGLDQSLVHLIDIRVSQINGCGFYLDMHLQSARDHGEDQQRLDVLTAWHETDFFTQPEQAALAWCEALTRMTDKTAIQNAYDTLATCFSSEEIVNLTAATVIINSWNRIVAGMGFMPTRLAATPVRRAQ